MNRWLANGCAPQAQVHGSDALKLQVGMSREEVLAMIGRPQAVETYAALEFWLYRDFAEDGRTPHALQQTSLSV